MRLALLALILIQSPQVQDSKPSPTIPPERGKYGVSDEVAQEEGSSKLRLKAIGKEILDECRGWKDESARKLIEFLSAPAGTPKDLVRKVALVRYGVPEFEAAPSTLLAIVASRQHRWVRRAAIAALYGFHLNLEAPENAPLTLSPANLHPVACGCSKASIETAAPESARLLKILLADPEAADLGGDLYKVFGLITQDGQVFPPPLPDRAADIRKFLGFNRQGSYFVAQFLAKIPDEKAAEILSKALLDPENRKPELLAMLLKAIEGNGAPLKSLRTAVASLKDELKDRSSDKDYAKVFERIEKILMRAEPPPAGK